MADFPSRHPSSSEESEAGVEKLFTDWFSVYVA